MFWIDSHLLSSKCRTNTISQLVFSLSSQVFDKQIYINVAKLFSLFVRLYQAMYYLGNI